MKSYREQKKHLSSESRPEARRELVSLFRSLDSVFSALGCHLIHALANYMLFAARVQASKCFSNLLYITNYQLITSYSLSCSSSNLTTYLEMPTTPLLDIFCVFNTSGTNRKGTLRLRQSRRVINDTNTVVTAPFLEFQSGGTGVRYDVPSNRLRGIFCE